jgi:hypothetical protein
MNVLQCFQVKMESTFWWFFYQLAMAQPKKPQASQAGGESEQTEKPGNNPGENTAASLCTPIFAVYIFMHSVLKLHCQKHIKHM